MPDCLLALETSSDRCGVALLCDVPGQGISVHRAEHDGAAEHSARILPMIDDVLARAGRLRTDIGAVAFGQGPGGFTGLRVACGVAQGIGFALSVPVVPVPSHAAVAWRLRDDAAGVQVIVLDARMDEAYAAVYRDAVCVQQPVLIGVADVPGWVLAKAAAWTGSETASSWALCVAGDLAATLTGLPEAWLRRDVMRPDVEAVAHVGLAAWRAGQAVAPEAAQPLYVRDKVAFTTSERALGAGGNPRAEALG